jgi:hypothetical protein
MCSGRALNGDLAKGGRGSGLQTWTTNGSCQALCFQDCCQCCVQSCEQSSGCRKGKVRNSRLARICASFAPLSRQQCRRLIRNHQYRIIRKSAVLYQFYFESKALRASSLCFVGTHCSRQLCSDESSISWPGLTTLDTVLGYLGGSAEIMKCDSLTFTVKVKMARDGAQFNLPIEAVVRPRG